MTTDTSVPQGGGSSRSTPSKAASARGAMMSTTPPESMVDVVLLAFGGPADLSAVAEFLARMTGRTPTDETVAAVRERYAAIGGASPLPEITARQARALQAKLVQELVFPVRVRHGFLFAEPGVAE
ncbi:MAG TPA: ferrochelatase, partial [Thermoleophilia bacterium]|nr:ferrochelatase [Thermoleophilia bacterium]